MKDDSISPEHEAQIIGELLRDQLGIDPCLLRPIIDLAALGLVNSAWRNSPVENWHADARITDGEMLRINSHTTWRFHQRLIRWVGERGLSSHGSTSDLDQIPVEEVDHLAGRLCRWLVNPRRKLPTGTTLRELAGNDLPDYRDHAAEALEGFAAQAKDRGTRFGFVRTAAHGGLACMHWWEHPAWPAQVSQFLHALDDPADQHRGASGEHKEPLPPQPAQVANRELLRKTLLTHPWQLDADTSEWLVLAGIRYVRHRA